MSSATKPNAHTHTARDLEKIQRLNDELTVLDNEVAHHRREIKHIREARKEVEAELRTLQQASDEATRATASGAFLSA